MDGGREGGREDEDEDEDEDADEDDEEEYSPCHLPPPPGTHRDTLLSRLQDRGSRGKLYRRLILAPTSPYRPQDKFIYQVLCGESEFRG